MKILFLHSTLSEKDYGGLTHQVELVKNLSKISELYIVPKGGGLATCFSESDELPVLKERGPFDTIRHFLRSLRWGYCSIRKTHFDVIYARHGVSTIPALLLGNYRTVPVVIELNGILADEFSISNKWFGWGTPLKILDYLGCKHSTHNISVTKGLSEYISEHFERSKDKITTIPNGANTSRFLPMNMMECRKTLGLSANSNYILFVGNLSAWQGVEYLIKAMPAVIKKKSSAKLIIVGSGELAPSLKALTSKMGIESSVIFTGALEYEKVPIYVNASDVCAAPFIISRNERIGLSPLKVYEYAACGKVLVASRINNLEFVEHEGIGTLFEPENSQSLAESIIWVLSHEKEAADMGKRGREYVVRECSWEAVSKRVLEVCSKVSDETAAKRKINKPE